MIISMSLLYALVYVMMFFLAKGNIVIFIVLTILTTIPNSFLGVIRSFIIPDLIEYSRYKSHQDCSGIFYALLSFVNKMMNSIGSSIGLFILGFCGWVTVNATDFADLAAQNVVQPENAINMLWCISTLLPAIGCVLGAVIMLFYKLKDKDTQLMAQCNAGDITREECEAQLSRKY